MRKHQQLGWIGLALLASGLLGGCTDVQPWQKAHLAKSHMAFDPDPIETRERQHIYFSKEASSGGYGIGGGGCGCN